MEAIMNTRTVWNIPATALAAEFYTRAERGDLIQVPTYQVCQCGFKFTNFDTARIWYFTRKRSNTTAVFALCGGCDRLNIAEMEEGK